MQNLEIVLTDKNKVIKRSEPVFAFETFFEASTDYNLELLNIKKCKKDEDTLDIGWGIIEDAMESSPNSVRLLAMSFSSPCSGIIRYGHENLSSIVPTVEFESPYAQDNRPWEIKKREWNNFPGESVYGYRYSFNYFQKITPKLLNQIKKKDKRYECHAIRDYRRTRQKSILF